MGYVYVVPCLECAPVCVLSTISDVCSMLDVVMIVLRGRVMLVPRKKKKKNLLARVKNLSSGPVALVCKSI